MIGFDFRQQQIARIQQARCLTFTRNLEGSRRSRERAGPRPATGGPALRRPVAVQAGVVTNMEDAARARAFFEGLGYRARTQGSQRLGTRVYRRGADRRAGRRDRRHRREAGFVGPFPSRFVTY